MRKWIALALALALTFSLAACGNQAAPEDAGVSETVDDATTPDDTAATPDDTATTPDAATPDDSATTPDPDDNAETIANPFSDYATYAEAEAAAGFPFGVPEEIGGYDTVSYRVANDLSLFEVIYANDDASLTARKAPGGWDISGDYNEYTQEVAQTLQGVNVTCWGDGESLFLAMWTVDDYSYSLGASQTIDRLDFLGTVETIIALNA
ncbi:MAG: hypothetical protein IJR48_00185 [Oscillibacter sp.]|nr:hypothetical protein [Oscillibacter sp.]MBQ9616755.1 hypothetical protein [Oscillibacter sp.]